MSKRNNSVRINYFFVSAVIILFGIIIAKTIYISYAKTIDGVDIKKYAENRNSATDTLIASRGNIYSSDEKVLAEDVNSYTVVAYLSPSRTQDINKPRHVVDKEYTANVLGEYINMSPEKILNLLNFSGYQVELGPGGRNISERLKEEIAALDLPGIGFISSSKRYYPFGDFAPYIIGYAKKHDNGAIVGELGVESYYNKELTGTNGYRTYQQDAYGYQIADTKEIVEDAKSGNDIYLTIDTNIQMYLENSIENLMSTNPTDWITVTVANAKTGAILGSASNPSYNPNILNITNYNNPLTSYTYEPGSTMKIFSFMAAIDLGKYDGDAKFNSGIIKVADSVISDWNKAGWGSISFDTGFTYSSNVAAVKLGQVLGRDALVNYYKKFGFGKKTGIEMSNEYAGTINPNYEVEVVNAAFGQGITTTPIQNIQALTSLANEGMVIKPYIVEKIVDHDTGETIYKNEKTEVGQAVSKETVDKMLELMYKTVNGPDTAATGLSYKTQSTTLIGKTGTAQYVGKNGTYLTSSSTSIRSFAGLFPYENPEYIIYLSIKDLTGSTRGMYSMVKSIVESIAKYKDLDELKVTEDENKTVEIQNYINGTTKDALNKLNDKGLTIIEIGDGDRVINQYPYKGSTLIQGNKIFIQTNSLNITMPDMTRWTSNDVGSYCTLVGMKCDVNGYGTVANQSIEPGTLIGSSTNLLINLSK